MTIAWSWWVGAVAVVVGACGGDVVGGGGGGYGPDSGVTPTAVEGCFELNTEPDDMACTQDSDCTMQVAQAVLCQNRPCDVGAIAAMNTAAAARIAREATSVSLGSCTFAPAQDNGAFCVNGSCTTVHHEASATADAGG